MTIDAKENATMNATADVETKPDDDAEDDKENVLYFEQYRPPWLPAIILFPIILPLFWYYHVRVTETHVSFGYNNFTVRRRPIWSTSKKQNRLNASVDCRIGKQASLCVVPQATDADETSFSRC
jgi:hypothetical protein